MITYTAARNAPIRTAPIVPSSVELIAATEAEMMIKKGDEDGDDPGEEH
jgi:hypothetical protein